MTESNIDLLVQQADELLYEKQDITGALDLYHQVVRLYQESGDLRRAASVLMAKIALNLQDLTSFYAEAMDAYEEAAQLYAEGADTEQSSNALLSSALVAEKAGDGPRAVHLFVQAGKGFEVVAKAYWTKGQHEFAWDNLQLASICWKNALKNTNFIDPFTVAS